MKKSTCNLPYARSNSNLNECIGDYALIEIADDENRVYRYRPKVWVADCLSSGRDSGIKSCFSNP
jgi:hypothetical protein